MERIPPQSFYSELFFSIYLDQKDILLFQIQVIEVLSELNLPLMEAARGGNGLVCGCSRRIILEEFCILRKSFYVASVEFLHVITRGNIQKWEAGVYSFRHKRNVYKKREGYFFRCFTLISKRQSGFIFFPDKENTNVFLVLSFLGEAIKVQMYNFLPFRDQNTDGGDQCTLLLLHRAN